LTVKCGEIFASNRSYNKHTQKHLQTHINTWIKQDEQVPPPLKRELIKVFEKYGIDDSKVILCFWKGGFN